MTPVPIQLCNEWPTIVPCPRKCVQTLCSAMTINRLCPNDIVLRPTVALLPTVRLDRCYSSARELVWETPTLAYLTKFVQLRLRMPDSPTTSLVSTQKSPTNAIRSYEANWSTMNTLLWCLCTEQPQNRTIVADSYCHTNNSPFACVVTSGAQPNLCIRTPDVNLTRKTITITFKNIFKK